MQLLNLSCSNDGQIVSAELGDHWRRMFEQLPSLGDGLVMTRNEAAILGRNMAFPELVSRLTESKAPAGQAVFGSTSARWEQRAPSICEASRGTSLASSLRMPRGA
jgi:hypothetical protein